MSIERNKEDFELAINRADIVLSKMRGIVDDGLISQIDEVIGEYEEYFKISIEELITRCSQLEKKIDEYIMDQCGCCDHVGQ